LYGYRRKKVRGVKENNLRPPEVLHYDRGMTFRKAICFIGVYIALLVVTIVIGNLSGLITPKAPDGCSGRIPSLCSNYADRVKCDSFDWSGAGGWGWVECNIGPDIIKVYCREGFYTRTNDHHDQEVICTHDGKTDIFYRP
jgi:hypothetical protein